MEFECDDAKDATNVAKHGISLREAARLDRVTGVTVPDDRFDYGELRFLRYAVIAGRMHTCAFTLRDQIVRIVTLRKSNNREIRKHGTSNQKTHD